MSMSTDSMSDDVQYGDHEHQYIVLAGQTADTTSEDRFDTFEPLGKFNGLEPDEVAELVVYERRLSYGGGSFEFGLGFNVSEGEFPEQAANNNPTAEDVSADSDIIDAQANYTDAGVIDFFSDDNATQSSGDDAERVMYNYRDMTGTGPYIDQTDDIDLHIEHSNQTGSNKSIGVQVRMVWDVTQVEEGIPEFALPRR